MSDEKAFRLMRRGVLRAGVATIGDIGVLSWAQWQNAVLALLRADFAEVLQFIGMEEVDWDSWRNFYIEGRTPKSAVDRALERDF